MFVRALLSGELNVRSLVLLFENLEPVYEELEAQLRRTPDDPPISLFDHRLIDRAARLRSDVHGLGRRATARTSQASRDYVRIVRESAASPSPAGCVHRT